MSLYQSLYETALKQGLPRSIIDVMTRVFANDVDFQRATAPGDSVEAFFSDPDDINPRPELLCASMTVRDQTFKYYRFQTTDDNMVDFYDENGRSMRKFLVRKPIAEGDMTSPFGMRFHPILHYARMHTGVDWAAPIGTPIYAAGNGTIIKAGWDGGYGRRVEIQHANGYVTAYNHMSGFGRGDRRGRACRSRPNRRLSRRFGAGDRPAPPLRGDHQRQLRRPDGDQAAAHARVRRQDACRVQARARPHRSAHGRVPLRRGDGGGEGVRIDPPRPRSFNRTRPQVRRRRPHRTPMRRGRRPGPSLSRAIRPATRTDGFSTVSLRSGREPAGGADSAAPARPSNACSRRWTAVAASRSRPRTTSVTPCSASSTTTARW